MKRIHTAAIAAAATGGFLLAGFLPAADGSAPIAEKAAPPAPAAAPYQIVTRPTHWTDEHLSAFAAEATPEQSVYLSCVQLVEIEGRFGQDATKVIPQLEQVAARTQSMQLRSALRRLIAEISLKRRDWKTAEKQLNAIIEEGVTAPGQ